MNSDYAEAILPQSIDELIEFFIDNKDRIQSWGIDTTKTHLNLDVVIEPNNDEEVAQK